MKGFMSLMRLSALNHAAALRKGSWYKSNGKLDASRIFTTIMVVLSFGYLTGLLVWMQIALFDALVSFGQPMLLVAIALLLAVVSTLLLGIFMVLSGLYFNKDAPRLAYLPVSSRAVFTLRWTEIWAGDALINLVLLAPSVILYGLKAGCDAFYYIRAITIALASPLIPLTIMTFLTTLLTRFTRVTRHKDAVVMAGSMLIVVVVVGLEMAILPKIPEDAGALFFVQLLLNQETLINTLLGAFPPILWALRGIEGNWLQWTMFVGVSLFSAAACISLLGPGYMKICLSQTEHAGSRKKTASISNSSRWKKHSPVFALFIREWQELLRTPVYAMNSLIGVIMLPVMCIFIVLGVQSSGENVALIVPMLLGVFHDLSAADIILIFTAAFSFTCLMNPVTCTSVSREGGRLGMSRMIPVSSMNQLRAKILAGMSVNILSNIGMVILISCVLGDYALLMIPAFILSTLLSYASSALGLTIDAIRPMLSWSNENQVMKQNFNFMIQMLLAMVMIALPAAAAFMLLDSSGIIRLAVVSGAFLAEAAAGFALLHFVGVKRYAALEG